MVADNEIFRRGVCTLLEADDEIVVCGEAWGTEEAVKIARETRPDVAVIGLGSSDGMSTEAIEAIKVHLPKTKVVAVSDHVDGKTFLDSIVAGASAFLVKGVEASALVRVVREVAQGASYIDPAFHDVALEYLHRDVGRLSRLANHPRMTVLTKRQKEIVMTLARGLDNRQISKELLISVQTVKNHLSNMYSKLGVRSRTELIALLDDLS